MLTINARQQAMLKEMGIRLPWPKNTPLTKTSATLPQPTERIAQIKAQHPRQTTQAQQKTHVAVSRPKQTQQPQENTTPAIKVHPQHAPHIAGLSWQELEATISECTLCTLCKSRTQTVFGAGDPHAQWMIIGEAPGEQEDKQGSPFVGPAGQLLDRMLQQINLSRTPNEKQNPIYIANVLKCRPPRNRNPEPQEMAQCELYLQRQIELIQPKVILLMGRFALQTLLKTHEAIGRMRKRVHHYQNIPVIVTYHPAYLLRNPVDKRRSWEDLCLAAETFTQLPQT